MNQVEALAALAVETWKLQATLRRSATDLAEEKRARVEAQLRYSGGQLERILAEADLRLVTFDGEEFSAELPVSPVNAEDLKGAKMTFIDQTLEPTVVAAGSVVRIGRVLLRGQ